MEKIKLIILILFLLISFSQNINKHNIFIKAQLLPAIGINYKLTDYTIFRHSLLVGESGFIGNIAMLFDIYEGKKFSYYLGSSYSIDLSESLDFRSMGMLISAELPFKNKFEFFGELGIDISTGESLE